MIMADFKIFTDSTCDIHPDMLKEWGVTYFPLTFYFTDDEAVQYNDTGMDSKEFFDNLRKGRTARTAGTNIEVIKGCFRKALLEGSDILYIGFSSALSSTYQSACLAAEELIKEFPERDIRCVDSLCESTGEGMLIRLCCDKRDAGASLTDTEKFAVENRAMIHHWFTVDDMGCLLRGGRVSKAAALAATVLNIKPLLASDSEGRLYLVDKVRGRKKSIAALFNKYAELAEDPGRTRIYICHADCADDVSYLESLFKDKYGLSADIIVPVGSVIGSHTGPGTIGLFFVGKESKK